jgi:putative membrane protein
MALEEITQLYPKLVAGLLSHKGIGFIMGRSNEDGALVLGAKGKYHLADDKVEDEDPLQNFEENAAAHLRRMDTFDNAPDLLVISMYDPQKEEVAAFEELIGSHGGLGGCQSYPFILYPSEWGWGDGEVVGAEKVHGLFKTKIRERNH